MTLFRPFGAALLLSLTLALPGLAQTTTDGQAATPPGGDLSMGADPNAPTGLPTQETAAVGQTYLQQTIDAWDVRCRKTADGADPCLLYQLLKDSQGNPVAEISIFSLSGSSQAVAGATVVAPLETLLTKQLGMQIDGVPAKIYPFSFCTKDGCVAKVGFTPDELDALKKGAQAQVVIVPAAAPDKQVGLSISLKGFTAGYTAVEKSRTK